MTNIASAPEGIRRRNLSLVLRLVHDAPAISRADVTSATGLNRSTIADLIAELVELGLVIETDPPARTGVGRPSPSVIPDPSVVAIAVNPEVDAITIAVVGLRAQVEYRVRHELDRVVDPAIATQIISEEIAQLRAGLGDRRIAGVGLAVPGLVRSSDGVIRWAPHLRWSDAPLARLVSAATGLPASAANDASLGALAEHRFGVGRGVADLIYLNGGASGIGGGVIAGGQPLDGARGYAGEFGQNRPGVASGVQRVSADGTLEDEVSRARLLATVGLESADEPTLAAALAATDSAEARTEIARQRRILSTALSNAANVLNPELIVLGGFLATLLTSDPIELERLVVEQTVAASTEGLRIRPAALGNDLLMIGAAELAFAPLLADPAGIALYPANG